MTDDLSFLAEPGRLADWRMVLVADLARRSRILDALPGTADQVAVRANVHPKSARILLDALSVFDVVLCEEEGGRYRAGPAMPDADQRRTIAQHARFIGRWSDELGARLEDPVDHDRRPWVRSGLESWLSALGSRAGTVAPGIIDRCLDAFPDARTVLDVAGGHGAYGIEAARRGLDVTLLDLPPVIDIVSTWPSVQESGIRTWSGDIFESRPPETFDLVLAFGFTHTQPAARVATLIRRLAAMTNPGGGLAVNTFVRGDGAVARLFAVQMLIAGNNGDTHRLEDYVSWMTGGGYAEPTVHHHEGRTLLLAGKASV